MVVLYEGFYIGRDKFSAFFLLALLELLIFIRLIPYPAPTSVWSFFLLRPPLPQNCTGASLRLPAASSASKTASDVHPAEL